MRMSTRHVWLSAVPSPTRLPMLNGMPTTPRFRRTRRARAVLLVGAIVTSTAVALTLVLARNQVLRAVAAGSTASTSASVLTVIRPESAGIWNSGSPTSEGTKLPSGDEQFPIGNVTKTFVATGILQLVDEGRTELDAPIETYLPGVVPNGANISVRQILNHTSGLYDYMKGRAGPPTGGVAMRASPTTRPTNCWPRHSSTRRTSRQERISATRTPTTSWRASSSKPSRGTRTAW